MAEMPYDAAVGQVALEFSKALESTLKMRDNEEAGLKSRFALYAACRKAVQGDPPDLANIT